MFVSSPNGLIQGVIIDHPTKVFEISPLIYRAPAATYGGIAASTIPSIDGSMMAVSWFPNGKTNLSWIVRNKLTHLPIGIGGAPALINTDDIVNYVSNGSGARLTVRINPALIAAYKSYTATTGFWNHAAGELSTATDCNVDGVRIIGFSEKNNISYNPVTNLIEDYPLAIIEV